MKNIVQGKSSIRGMQNTMTNMTNTHTCSTGGVDLLATVVLLTHGELVQLAGDVVGGARVGVPRGVNVVCSMCGIDVLLVGDVGLIKAMPTCSGSVPHLEAHLAAWALGGATIVGVVEPRGVVVVAPLVPAATAAAAMAALRSTTTVASAATATAAASIGHIHRGLGTPSEHGQALLEAEKLGQ